MEEIKTVAETQETDETLGENLIAAWVSLTSVLKNSRLTQGMNYNEAIVMLLAYRRYLADGQGLISFKEITQETKMLKSLVNRTIDSLEKKGFLKRFSGADKRMTFVCVVQENLDKYLSVHEQSLQIARQIVEIIGEESAKTFIDIAGKITAANPIHREEK